MEGSEMSKVVIIIGAILLVAAIFGSIWYYLHYRKVKQELEHSLWNANRIQGKLNQATLDKKEKDKRIRELEESLAMMKEREEERHRQATMVSVEDRIEELKSQPICIKILTRINEANIKTMASYPDLELSENLQNQLIKSVDDIFDSFSLRIFNIYPRLTRGDIIYCCLYMIGINEKGAAVLTGKTYQTVWTRSNKLRDIFGNRGDMETVIKDVLRHF